MKKYDKLKKRLICAAMMAMVLVSPAQATNNLAESPLGQGVQNMINDATSWLLVLCPLAGGLCALVFLICRSAADEDTDGKRWTKRIKVALICGAAGCLVSGVIKLITSYFV